MGCIGHNSEGACDVTTDELDEEEKRGKDAGIYESAGFFLGAMVGGRLGD